MPKKIIKYSIMILSSLFLSVLCIGILNTIYTSLTPYYKYTESMLSEDAVFEILKDQYPNAYYPYKNLDYLINDYEGISHIYKLSFPQKSPKYVYSIKESSLTSVYSFLVIFSEHGTLEDIIFLNEDYNQFQNSTNETTKLMNKLRGTEAKDIIIDSVSGASIESNYILKGINSAANNFIYEVQSHWESFFYI